MHLVSIGMLSTALAQAPPPSVPEALAQREAFAFADGSSIYTFHSDHRFELGPVGMSGRTIAGVWTDGDNGLVVTGQWGWINGLSRTDDFREMVLHVTPHPGEATKVGHAQVEVQPVYFTIDGLRPVSKAVFDERKKALLKP